MNRRLTLIAETRNVTFCTQFFLLLKRFNTHAYRTRVSIFALMFMGVFTAFLQASIYHSVAAELPSSEN